MIPKVIHYCWYGDKEIPEQHQQFIAGWMKLMPDYEFRLWNESNSPMHLPYLKTARQHRKWANMSNFMRLHATYQEGGIYLDTDMEVIKKFDDLLNNQCFFAFETQEDEEPLVNNAVFGALPRHQFIKACRTRLLTHFTGEEPANVSAPILTTMLLREMGLRSYGRQILDGIALFEHELFYPYHWTENFNKDIVTSSTYAIHHWSKSWLDSNGSPKVKVKIDYQSKFKLYQSIYKYYGIPGLKLLRKMIVQLGPFKGMKYRHFVPRSVDLFPKLVGYHNENLNKLIYDCMDNDYKKVINFGCGDGYYAVGLARFFPNTIVYAYDKKEEAIRLTAINAKENGVTDRVIARNIQYDSKMLSQEDFSERCLLVCDNGGYGLDFITEGNRERLINVDLIIPFDDLLNPLTKTRILEVFRDSHTLSIVNQTTLSPSLRNFLYDLKSGRKLLNLFAESRPNILQWALLSSKKSSG